MASIRSGVGRNGRGAGAVVAPRWWAVGLTVAVLLLLAIGVHRAFVLVDSSTVPRDGIGETRWYAFAVRPDLHEPLQQWLAAVEEGAGGVGEFAGLDGSYDLGAVQEPDRNWLLTILRYSCPGSTVVLVGDELHVGPACRPELPEFLEGERRRAHGVWVGSLVSFLLFGLALAGGFTKPDAGSPAMADWLLAGLAGWALTTVLAGAGWAIGLTGSMSFVWAVPGAVGLLVWTRRVRGGDWRSKATEVEPPRATRWSILDWTCLACGVLMSVVTAGKILRSEVWSWDYLATWGFRARKLASGATDFLQNSGFEGSNPDYPLGLAFAWLTANGGRPPVGGDIRVATLVMLAVLGALLWSMLREANTPLRVLLVGAMLGGPLAWDTEGLGLAELPLVMWITAAVALWSREDRPAPAWFSLLFLVMVAWSKPEGLVVAVALSLPGVVWIRARSGIRAAVFWLSGLAVSLAIVRWVTAVQTAHGTGFLDGALRERLAERVRSPFEVLDLLPGTLLHAQWVPWYLVAGLLASLALNAGRWRPARLPLSGWTLLVSAAAIVVAYVLVYFGTYLSPADHVATSWHRILAPALWIFVLGWAKCWSELAARKE